ncbi:multidrug transporter [Sphingomonas sp. ABOLG]|uniref:SapC family protein n=1 Tax=Sphingomonas sp. ABOLG TaxID=1985880 RepID=UPI000F7F4527|nr:SapC family protein [Sphingomonas sp. ABOLG]RSV13352.1 multidrug transporter [Sphingomonas sp. ABOLG]
MNPHHAILTPEAHRDLRVRIDRDVALGDGVMTSVVMPAEFRDAQQHYPILFRLNAERDDFTAHAIFGFETAENLFLEGARWDADYVPLALDVQPFLIGGPDASGARQVHIDLGSPRIAGEEGVRVFEPEGTPTPFLETIADRLGALHTGFEESAAFFAALRRHDLLEPLTLEVTLNDGSTHRLVGFHVIDEGRLRALDGAALTELHGEGHLMPIFMALASLGNLRALVARKNKRDGHG